jgi:hypothetical protein
MHLALAQRLIQDPELPPAMRDTLATGWGPFLLGSIAPDARVSSGIARTSTHFFEYGPVVDPSPVPNMLSLHPELRQIADVAKRAFIVGYVAHLVMDEIWCVDLLYPIFYREWGTPRDRFILLHMLLSFLDERDFGAILGTDQHLALATAQPTHWLPFLPDPDLVTWRNLIAEQIVPPGNNRTFEILGSRIAMQPHELAAIVHDTRQMSRLWTQLSPQVLSDVESAMYAGVRTAVRDYLT